MAKRHTFEFPSETTAIRQVSQDEDARKAGKSVNLTIVLDWKASTAGAVMKAAEDAAVVRIQARWKAGKLKPDASGVIRTSIDRLGFTGGNPIEALKREIAGLPDDQKIARLRAMLGIEESESA
jgi:hypothetical protein